MTDYKISRFTMTEHLSGDMIAVFNTLTRGLGVLPNDVWEQCLIDPALADGALAELIAQGFVVEAGLDENQVLAHWRYSQSYDLTHLVYIISPTHACNMACSYCVHGEKKRGEHMRPETARAVLDFMIRDVELKQPLSVRMDFGGAEALLNPKIVLYLSEGMARFCHGRKTDLSISLITNGLKLDQELIQSLIPFGLDRIRVTVSGPSRIHDRYRPTRDGGPTFSRIMSNLSATAGLVRIGLQGQYNPLNAEHLYFPELLDELIAMGLRENLDDVAFGPFLPIDQEENHPAAMVNDSVNCLMDEDPGRFLWLRDQVTGKGFKSYQGPPANRCLANYRNSMVIDVDGTMAACPSMMDFPDLVYGDVWQGVNFRKEAGLLARELPIECREKCDIAPLCDGGCRHQALMRTGHFEDVNCLRQTFEVLTRAYIRQAAQALE